MARSLNKAQLLGRLGKDPEAKQFSNGGSAVTFSIATTDQWKDRSTGERREKTEWHRVAIFSEPLGRIAQQYLKKGDQVYIEGKMETRKWTDQQNQERFTTEVVLRPYQGELTLLGGRGNGDRDTSRDQSHAPERKPQHRQEYPSTQAASGGGYGQYGGNTGYSYPDDEIPF